MILEFFKRLWIGWNKGIRGLFWLQTAIVMSIAFVLGIAPVAIFFKLTGRKLLDRSPARPDQPSYWVARPRRTLSMKEASRQF
jgi:hypothetical protein